MGAMDVGLSTANGLYQQAAAGTFTMEAGVAKECADAYKRLVDNTIDPQIVRARNLYSLQGFSTFTSSKELKAGFEGKARDLVNALESAKEAALQMAAAHLLAGKLIQEADEMHRQSIKVTTEEIGK
ncbi:hypothetical protein ABIA39_003970 [Nocardia sp. GAS34]|uniref:hypothetical protein n=1 Tax=unclassified Nocardia TaxID=2637762 RepID=UPI003D1AFE3E